MRKHKRITGLLACLLAASVISAGMMIPKILIEGQRENIFGNTHIIMMYDKNPISFLQGAPIVDISRTELINRLSSWMEKSGISVFREPYQNELTMEAAFSAAKREMQKMMDMGVIPNLSIRQYRLNSAELCANSATGAARWTLKISYNEEQAALYMDAETGKIYSLELFCPQSDDLSNRERLAFFAQYHGLDPDEQTFEYKDRGDWDILKIGSLMIQVQNSSPAEDNLQLSIVLDIAN